MRRNVWVWVSGVLAVAVVGLLVWGLGTDSDRSEAEDDLEVTQQQLASTQDELDTTQDELETANEDLQQYEADVVPADKTRRRAVITAATFATMKSLYDDLASDLGATQDDLAATEKELDDAKTAAAEAEEDVDAAKERAEEADDDTEKAQAEAEQARAEADAAPSKAEITLACVRAYITAFGMLFEGDDPGERAPAVKDEIAGVTDDCQAAVAGE